MAYLVKDSVVRAEKMVRIEKAVDDSDFADSSKKKWHRECGDWANNYQLTGSIYMS